MKSIRILSLLPVLASFASAQQPSIGPLSNKRIVELLHAGIRADELIRVIATAPEVSFALTPDETKLLLEAGVTEDVIKVMAGRQHEGPIKTVSTRTQSGPSYSKPRIYIDDSPNSWSYERGGGSHPQTVEFMKTVEQACPGAVVTRDPKQADYFVRFEREAHKFVRKDNKLAVFNASDDLIFATSTRALGNAVRGFCNSRAFEAIPSSSPAVISGSSW